MCLCLCNFCSFLCLETHQLILLAGYVRTLPKVDRDKLRAQCRKSSKKKHVYASATLTCFSHPSMFTFTLTFSPLSCTTSQNLFLVHAPKSSRHSEPLRRHMYARITSSSHLSRPYPHRRFPRKIAESKDQASKSASSKGWRWPNQTPPHPSAAPRCQSWTR